MIISDTGSISAGALSRLGRDARIVPRRGARLEPHAAERRRQQREQQHPSRIAAVHGAALTRLISLQRR